MTKLPAFYVFKNNGLNTVWKYVSHGPNFVWLERLGDGVSHKLTHTDYISNYIPIRSLVLTEKLMSICEQEHGLVGEHIYDVYEEPGDDGSWFKLYKTTIHHMDFQREHIYLKAKSYD